MTIPTTTDDLIAEIEAAAKSDFKCEYCHGQGEVYSGRDQHFHYFDFQPPEPIMDICPDCNGDDLTPSPANVLALIARIRELENTLDDIGGLSSALRVGGPDPMDLQGLSDALEEAIDMAHGALHPTVPDSP